MPDAYFAYSKNLNFVVADKLDMLSISSQPRIDLSEHEVGREACHACCFTQRAFNQETHGICGPISVLHAFAQDAPDRFGGFAGEVCQKDARLVPENLVDEFNGVRKHNTLVRILSAYLTNGQNTLMTYEGSNSIGDYLACAAFPSDIVAWLEKVFPNREVTSYSSYCWGAVDNAEAVNQLWASSERQPIIIAFVNGYRIQSKQDKVAYSLPGILGILGGAGHYVHITSPFQKVEDGYEFKAYNFGMDHTYRFSESEFEKVFYGLMVAC